ncbi:MAG: ECF-type sigma factor [Gemmatimonadota bacterium]
MATWQAIKAGRARDEVRAALRQSEDVRDVLGGLLDADAPSPLKVQVASVKLILARGVEKAESIEGDPLLKAEMLHGLGRAYRGYRDYARAGELLERALALGREAHPDGHIDVARRLADLGYVSYRRGRLADAEKLLRETLTMEEGLLGTSDPLLAETLNYLGYVCRSLDRPAAVLESFRRALAIRREALSPDDPLVARSLHDLAVNLWQTGDLGQAERLFREAIDVRRRGTGSEDPRVGTEMVYLADVLAASGRETEAETLYREALALQERSLGEDHYQLAHALHSLGNLLGERGEFGEAERLFRRSVSIQRNTWGPMHLNTLSSEAELAALLHRVREGDRAALEAVFPLVYEELHRLAGRERDRWRGDETLRTTALVHETYIRLVGQQSPDWKDRAHFKAVAAVAMRQILIDYARRRLAKVRGGDRRRVSLQDVTEALQSAPEFTADKAVAVVALDRSLKRLERVSEELSRVVECRVFGGRCMPPATLAHCPS